MICNWKQHFDIQRFAAAGTQTTGTSTLSAEMKTFYDKTLLDNAEPQLVHDQFGQERNIPAHGGKTIEFRKFSSLAKATTALTEGVTPGRQEPDRDQQDRHGGAVRRLHCAERYAGAYRH